MTISSLQITHYKIWIGRLQQGLKDLESYNQGVIGSPETEADSQANIPGKPRNKIEALSDTLEALRELGGLFLPLEVLQTTDILEILTSILTHQVHSHFESEILYCLSWKVPLALNITELFARNCDTDIFVYLLYYFNFFHKSMTCQIVIGFENFSYCMQISVIWFAPLMLCNSC